MRHTIRPGCSRTRAFSSRRSGRRPAARQSGQALIFGMFLLVIVAVLTFYQFSTGQVTTARMRLVNATDAAAYSAGLWRARAFNYYAYSNRAIIFNEVAIAQTATLVSYAGFITQAVKNLETVSRVIPPLNAYLRAVERVVTNLNKALRIMSAVEVAGRSAYIHALAVSQDVIWGTTNGYVLNQLTNEVMKKTDEHFHGYLIRGTLGDQMTRNHGDEDRSRLKDLVQRSLDEYSVNRGLTLRILGTKDVLVWRGQTEMIRDHDTNAMDRWQSYDTLSIHHRRWRHKRRTREAMPLAWSGVEIAKDPKQSMDRLNGQASSQKHDNGRAYRLIDRSGFWSARAYLGLPAVRDLDENSKAMRENSRFPTDKVTVIGVIQKKNTINTADQTGLGAGRLKLKDAFADFRRDAAMVAMSSAQVYFRRPPGGNERVEYASMYSPYWQVRLVGVDAQERAMAGALGTLGR